MPENNSPAENPPVPWGDVVRFVRQLSHDLRNHLNAAELQSVYLNEIATDPEIKNEIKRLRETISGMGSALQKLSAALTPPKPDIIPYGAADLMEDIQRKFENDFPDRKSGVQWQVEADNATLHVDPQLVQQVMFELLENAFRYGTEQLSVSARTAGDKFIVTVRETKKQSDASTENWGRQPLGKVGQGHYGLGLARARGIIEAHAGDYRAEYDSATSTLVSTIALPFSRSLS